MYTAEGLSDFPMRTIAPQPFLPLRLPAAASPTRTAAIVAAAAAAAAARRFCDRFC